ncbi:MAG: hypothetical protein HQK77_22110 [Desulfobacterales bacterium]|nr:hypothetical protein [Desulfobacterales bacterium]
MFRFFQILICGPFFYITHSWILSLSLLIIILLLTVITQVGGIILWLSLPVMDRIRIHQNFFRWSAKTLAVLSIYLLSIAVFIPLLASIGGRVPLPWFASSTVPLKPASLGYCLLARNYVRPELRRALEQIAQNLSTQHPDSTLLYLDANFPFINGFPLLPHLSHKDGKKVDLAFFYRSAKTKEPLIMTASPIGYFAYEQPKPFETKPCKGKKSWRRWDLDWLQPLFSFAEMDTVRTQVLLKELIKNSAIQKIFIEEHLKYRLNANATKVRFQGCGAARHDDHIHIQIQ